VELIFRFSMIYGSDNVPVPFQELVDISDASSASLLTWITGLEVRVVGFAPSAETSTPMNGLNIETINEMKMTNRIVLRIVLLMPSLFPSQQWCAR
jgi:hypothetical protein